jgi:undecaprenyl-diphosphatase
MYRLLEQLPPTAVDFSTDVAAYLCQAAGVALFVLAVRRRPTLAGKGPFALSLGADLALTLLALVVPGPVLTLITGLAMNLLHGVVAGYYLDRLASRVPWQRRGLVFGLGYGVASLASWGVSLLCGGTPLRLFPALVVCVLLAGSLDDMVVKPLVGRWRPTHDQEIGLLVDTVNNYRGGRFGFFSAHASNTFSLALFLALVVRSRVLSVTLAGWSLLNCWTRLYLGVHFPGDILVGLLWGGMVAIGVWYVYHRICTSVQPDIGAYISTQYTSTGYQRTDVDVVICVFFYTLLYALIRACFF